VIIRRTLFHSLCIYVALLVFTFDVQATSVPRNLQFTSFTAVDGLSSEFVRAVAQDGRGYIWFATQNGLNRFDGYEFVTYEYDPKDPTSLGNDFVWSLYVDDAGDLWASTNAGVNKYDYTTNSFQRNPLQLPEDARTERVRTMIKDHTGVFWLGTVDNGLIAVQPSGAIRRYQTTSKTYPLPHNHIIALHADRKRRLWVGTDGGGLLQLDGGTDTFYQYRNNPDNPASIAQDEIRTIYEDQSGYIWVGTAQGGLNLFDDATGAFRRFQHNPEDEYSLSEGQVTSILEDAKGTLWIGTENGLSEWRPLEQEFVNYQSDQQDTTGLVNNQINALFQDQSGVLWLATNRGISSWNYFSDTFTHYQKSSGFLSGDVVTSIAEAADGVLWIGTYGDGLTRLDLASNRKTEFRHDPDDPDSLSDDRVMSVHIDHQQQVWVGTRNGGLNRLSASGSFDRFQHAPRDPRSISGNAITTIASDPDGTLWVGVFDGGLNRTSTTDPGSFTRFIHDQGNERSISNNRVVALHRDQSGQLWIGTEGGGINRLRQDESGFDRFSVVEESEPPNSDWGIVLTLMESKDGALWLGTMQNGLLRWDAETRKAGEASFQRFGKPEGVPTSIFGTVQGTNNEIWITGSGGLYRLNPADSSTIRYDRLNGLGTSEFIVAAQLRSPSGRLYFGSNQGLIAFYPSEITRNQRPPIVQLNAYSRDNLKPIAQSSSGETSPKITLAHSNAFVSFDFVALDFVSPDKNQYEYRLNGWDNNWISVDKFRGAIYSKLPTGDYLFEVRGSNNDGVWSQQSAQIAVTVTPPLWRQNWAYACYFLILMLLVGGVLRTQRNKRIAEQRARDLLEQEVADRTSELASRNVDLQALNEKLAEASVTDSLTGLRNRRYVDQFIETEIAMVERRLIEGGHGKRDSSKLLFFMMIDLDGFKLVNDSHGHHAGDEVLLDVKDLLLQCCRTSDVVIRWGGDEFMVIGHSSSFNGVKILAERIRESIAEHTYQLSNGATAEISASIGVSPYPFFSRSSKGFNWEQVSAVADRAAYLAKENGRNAWVSLVGTAQLQPNDWAASSGDVAALIADKKFEIDSSIEGELILDGATSGRMVS
jgi:diguanylate cyclase (GGDEF)-like protein